MELVPLLFGFHGRISRGRFWDVIAGYFVAWLIVGLIAAFAFGARHASLSAGLPALALIAPIGVKRLHDRGRSGWRLLALFGLPVILDWMPDAAGDSLQSLGALIATALSIWAFVELGCLRGAAGANRFGPDPLAK